MAMHPECDGAVDEIVNDSIVMTEEDPVMINLDELDKLGWVSQKMKDIILAEFKGIVELLRFNARAYDIYRHWYIDGRIYFHTVIDRDNPKAGIQEMRYIDPRKIRKVREVEKVKVKSVPTQMAGGEPVVNRTRNEYYVFNERGFGNQAISSRSAPQATAGLKIAVDSIVYVPSGVTDVSGQMVVSYLHKAIRPLNQLRTLEDATVIYRLSRAPERRVWYIDTGSLPKMKAEQYVRDIMVKHKNRQVYDATTGEIRDDRKFMTMLEDYWLPRREGGRGTEVETLPAGQNLGQMEDVLYFQKKLYRSLNIPYERLDSNAVFTSGRPSEITREELKFAKFVGRLRMKFCEVFTKALERQLTLKNLMSYDDWLEVKDKIRYDFQKDSHFEEFKDNELLAGRLTVLEQIAPWVDRYYSNEYVRKKVLRQTDEKIEEIDQQIEDEQDIPQYQQPMPGEEVPEDETTSMDDEAPPAEIPFESGNDDRSKSPGQKDIGKAQKIYAQLKGEKNRTPAQKKRFAAAAETLGRAGSKGAKT